MRDSILTLENTGQKGKGVCVCVAGVRMGGGDRKSMCVEEGEGQRDRDPVLREEREGERESQTERDRQKESETNRERGERDSVERGREKER